MTEKVLWHRCQVWRQMTKNTYYISHSDSPSMWRRRWGLTWATWSPSSQLRTFFRLRLDSKRGQKYFLFTWPKKLFYSKYILFLRNLFRRKTRDLNGEKKYVRRPRRSLADWRWYSFCCRWRRRPPLLTPVGRAFPHSLPFPGLESVKTFSLSPSFLSVENFFNSFFLSFLRKLFWPVCTFLYSASCLA